MTKKHFIALADEIKRANRVTPNTFNNEAISRLSEFCYDQNANFKRDRWIAYINGECGKNGGKVK